MSSLGPVGVANLAIGWLGANRITSFDDAAVEAQLVKDNYDAMLGATLESYEWTFAQKRFIPAALSTPPAWGYTYQFTVPGDILRVHYVGQNDNIQEDAPCANWTREAGPSLDSSVILCDNSVIYCRGTARIDDLAAWSELAAIALAARLGAEIAMALTNSRNMAESMWSLFGKKIAEADRIDGKQGKARQIRAPGIINARQAGANIIGPRT